MPAVVVHQRDLGGRGAWPDLEAGLRDESHDREGDVGEPRSPAASTGRGSSLDIEHLRAMSWYGGGGLSDHGHRDSRHRHHSRRLRRGRRARASSGRSGSSTTTGCTAGCSTTATRTRPRWTAIVDAGAFVMGRNMFSPGRGEWDLDWRGWWGDDPPYHAPGVRAHPPRAGAGRDGGRHHVPLRHRRGRGRARARPGRCRRPRRLDRRWASTINAYLAAGAIDELRLHVVPFISGLTRGVTDVRRRAGARPGVGGCAVHAARHAPHLPAGLTGRSGSGSGFGFGFGFGYSRNDRSLPVVMESARPGN